MRQAQALIDVARAPGFPSLNAGGTNEKVGLAAGWELDLWGRIRRSVEASTAAAESSADDLAAATLSLQAQVAQNYFLLRVQDAEIRLLQDSVARYERSLQLTRNQYAVGVASRGDVVQAEAQLNSTRTQALEADADAGAARARHRRADRQGRRPISASRPRPLDAADPGGAAGAAFRVARPAPGHRRRGAPDGRGQRADRRRRGGVLSVGRASSPAAASTSASRAASRSRSSCSTAGCATRRSAQATAAYDETVAELPADGARARSATWRTTSPRCASSKSEAAVQAAAVKAARESVTITNNQYRAGIVTYLAVVVVQAAALVNERAELAILGRRLVASVNLIKALGGGWEPMPKPARRLARRSSARSGWTSAGAAASARRSRRPSSGTKRPRSSEKARTETRRRQPASTRRDAIDVVRRVPVDLPADRRCGGHADREVPAARRIEIGRRGKMRMAVQHQFRAAPREHVAQRGAVPQRLAPAHRVRRRRMVQQHDAEQPGAAGLAPACGPAAASWRFAQAAGGEERRRRAAPSTSRSGPRGAGCAGSETQSSASAPSPASSPRMYADHCANVSRHGSRT